MKKLFIILCCLFSFVVIFSLNALYPDHLTICDHVQIIEDEGSPMFMHEMMWENQENISLNEDIDLPDLIWEAMISSRVSFFSGDVLFDEDFPLHKVENQKQESLYTKYDLGDPEELKNIPHQIESLIFIENWYFDEEKFQLNKEVKGILPVRHFSRFDMYGEPIDGTKLMMPVAYIPFPEKLSKGAKKKINKRLVTVKKISYEFMLSELHFLGWYDSDISMSMDGIPLVKYNNPQWSNFQAEQFRRVLIDEALSCGNNVVSDETGEILNEEKIARLFNYAKNENGSYSEITDYDAAGNWEFEFSELPFMFDFYNQIFSVIFTEEWSIDPETLYIKKKVLSITPVFWVNEWEENTWNKKTLFRLDLN